MSWRFTNDVNNEVAMASATHAPINSLHEGYAVILEELDEAWAEIKKKREDRDETAIYMELVQVAAMCMRVADECGLTDQIDDFVREEQREDLILGGDWTLEEIEP